MGFSTVGVCLNSSGLMLDVYILFVHGYTFVPAVHALANHKKGKSFVMTNG